VLQTDHEADPTVSVVGVPCDVPVDYSDDTVWAAQVAVMSAAVRTVSDEPVDAVFTSESYGDELATRLTATHVLVDRERCAVPVSAGDVRSDLAGSWDWLAPSVRAGLTARVVLVGAESTGTSTISQFLADHYRELGGVWGRTRLVGEYGREYTETKWAWECREARGAGKDEPPLNALVWKPSDFDTVASEQRRLEQAAAMDSSPSAPANCCWTAPRPSPRQSLQRTRPSPAPCPPTDKAPTTGFRRSGERELLSVYNPSDQVMSTAWSTSLVDVTDFG
jgi:HTH-type transcriptional regulator, transcriptional repressor of NAD biosynthesis genes